MLQVDRRRRQEAEGQMQQKKMPQKVYGMKKKLCFGISRLSLFLKNTIKNIGHPALFHNILGAVNDTEFTGTVRQQFLGRSQITALFSRKPYAVLYLEFPNLFLTVNLGQWSISARS